MGKLVIDASVVVKWFVVESHSSERLGLFVSAGRKFTVLLCISSRPGAFTSPLLLLIHFALLCVFAPLREN